MADDEKIIPITIDLHVSRRAMFLKLAGATVSEGKYTGTTLCTNIGSPSPILYLRVDDKYVATGWITTKDLIGALILAVEAAAGDLEP